jgi:hypothetical protein
MSSDAAKTVDRATTRRMPDNLYRAIDELLMKGTSRNLKVSR